MKRYISFMLMVMLMISSMPMFVQAEELVQSATEPTELQDLVQYVNPLIGSNNFKGNSEFAGLAPFVTSPFGMTNFTPQTRQNSIGGISYLYSDKQFKGFFATHQPAIWMGDYGYVNVMPQIGDISPSESGRALTFDYKNNDSSKQENKEEVSTPYYYKAKMGSNVGKPITAEMTATERSAIYRYTFPANDKSSILVESARDRAKGSVTIDENNKEIYGWNNDNMSANLNNKPPQNLKGYFVIQFSKPFNAKGTYNNYVSTANGTSVEGQKSGGYVTFNTTANEVIEVRIGTSFISVDQARKNIEQEIGTKSFDTVKKELENTWNKKLNTIQIEGATTNEKYIFYTSMFHALMYPRMFYENVDGINKYYSPFDDQIHSGKSYTDFSIWDTFRAQNSFLTLVAPERIDDMVQSLLQTYQEGGYMPKWPNPNYTNIMIGTHADSLVAEAINKGFRGFDYNLAYQAVYKDAMAPQVGDGTIKWQDRQQNVPYEARAGLSAYKELGYIPNGYVKENVSNTIEGAYDDWAVAQVAKAVGKTEDYKFFQNRSQNYKNVINPSTGYAMGRDQDGNWTTAGEEFTEGGREKYTWFAPHDPQGLLDLMTKYKGANFYNTELEKAYGVGGNAWIEHQNEPTHHYAYMFDFSGRPDLTQKYARKTLVESYFNDTSGELGNDDCGQMSAWYVFSAMGFYPVNPASGEYMIGSPIFDKVTINNPKTGTKFVITAPNNDGNNFYISSAKLNSADLNIPVVTYGQITTGGTLDFGMSSTATDWARGYSKPALVYDVTAQSPENLTSITAPATVAGLSNGTAKTAAALGLPGKVSLVTNSGSLNANVTWDVNGTSYDPTVLTAQTFTVLGTVTLPVGISNPNNVPLTTSISVTVNQITAVPGKIEAENYSSMSGIQTEDSSEGTKNVSYIDSGDWMDYFVNVQKSGLYKVDYRVSVNGGTGIVNFLVDGVSNKITSLPSTGGWQNWKTVSDKVYLSAGKHTIRLAINSGGWNLNWFELSELPPTNLTSITAPAAITGVPIGTAKTAAELGLPGKVSLVTDAGNVDASVVWDLNSASYDPTATTAQTFTVPGTVTLPSGVANPNNVPLTTSISVSVKPAELLAHWKFDEGSGTTAGDSSGKGNTGTLVNNPSWTDSGKISGALAFSGGSRAEINPPATLNQTGDESVSLWFKTSQSSTGYADLFRQDKRFTALQLTGGGSARVAYWPNGSSSNQSLAFPWTYNDNNWHHYVASYSQTMGLKIYVDGNVVASNATILGPLPSVTNKIVLGANESGGEAYNGLLDDVRVFSGMLSQAQVTQLMNEGQGPTLQSITAPAALTAVLNGTVKTAEALGLPATVELVTDKGKMNASVSWDVNASSYDPSVKTVQTFTVGGTVALPIGVVNPNSVVLTTSISVTVLPAPATPKSTLTGLQQVVSGQTFTLKMGLADVMQSVYQQVYAQEFTLQYDSASVQFDSVTSLIDGFRVFDLKETASGQLRIVVASAGANVPAQGDLLTIKFKAKSVTQTTNTTISVDHVMIANSVGNELQVGGASREIQITVPAIPVDKSQLNAAIASAQAKYDAAVEGSGDGLYAIGSKAQLQSAIDAAKATTNNLNATQQQVDSAKTELELAIQVFESKKITADINGGGVSIGDLAVVAAAYGKQQGQVNWNEKADVNHDGKVDIDDLAIVARAILH